jgi:hypothetical protein
VNRSIRLIVVALVAGLGAYGLTRHFATPPAPASEVAWLVAEFQLTSAQSTEIETLHAQYEPICAAHCASIIETQNAINQATNPTEKSAAEYHLTQLIATCHASTQAHLQAVAAAMDPAQGQRYLAMIGPRLSAHQHAEPFGLR